MTKVRLRKGASADGKLVTSIRLRTSTKHFLQTQAESLGTSVHAVVTMILKGFAALSLPVAQSRADTTTTRFLKLMQSHGLSLIDIVDVMASCRSVGIRPAPGPMQAQQ
jgi:hypothetical protein